MTRPPEPTWKYFLILVIGALIMPFSGILALVAIFIAAKIADMPPISFQIKQKQKEATKEDLENILRNCYVEKKDKVFYCRSCGAVYTTRFLQDFEIPDKPTPNISISDSHYKCFYCGHIVQTAKNVRGYYESLANEDKIKIFGSAYFEKPLRYKRYVLIENEVNPDRELHLEYITYLKKQIFIHFVKYIHKGKMSGSKFTRLFDIEPIKILMHPNDNLEVMCHKYDNWGEGKEIFYDVLYVDSKQ